ncbi:MAG TPA: hypothetical protein DGF36_14395 [Alteromonas sp.]|nr:hypothetical protein [Alteromonas sp.]HCL12160.1 hypothetical protein [Alteromonas sp.]HCV19303.1 hypothetical protein [Alteromonas sp.]
MDITVAKRHNFIANSPQHSCFLMFMCIPNAYREPTINTRQAPHSHNGNI